MNKYTYNELSNCLRELESEHILMELFFRLRKPFSKVEMIELINEVSKQFDKKQPDYIKFITAMDKLKYGLDHPKIMKNLENAYFKSFTRHRKVFTCLVEAKCNHSTFIKNFTQLLMFEKSNGVYNDLPEDYEYYLHCLHLMNDSNFFNKVLEGALNRTYSVDPLRYAIKKSAPSNIINYDKLLQDFSDEVEKSAHISDTVKKRMISDELIFLKEPFVKKHLLNYITESDQKGKAILDFSINKLLDNFKWYLKVKTSMHEHINPQKFSSHEKGFYQKFEQNYDELCPDSMEKIFEHTLDDIDQLLKNHIQYIYLQLNGDIRVQEEFISKSTQDLTPLFDFIEDRKEKLLEFIYKQLNEYSKLLVKNIEVVNSMISKYKDSKKKDPIRILVGGIFQSPLFLGKIVYEEFTVHGSIRDAMQNYLDVYEKYTQSIQQIEMKIRQYYLQTLKICIDEEVSPFVKGKIEGKFVRNHFGIDFIEEEFADLSDNMKKETRVLPEGISFQYAFSDETYCFS